MRFKLSLLKTDALKKNRKSRPNANYSDSVLEKLVSLKTCKEMTILKLTNNSKKSRMMMENTSKTKTQSHAMTICVVINLTTTKIMTRRIIKVGETTSMMMMKTVISWEDTSTT
mgnify:CR=1 FL=1